MNPFDPAVSGHFDPWNFGHFDPEPVSGRIGFVTSNHYIADSVIMPAHNRHCVCPLYFQTYRRTY